MSVKQLLIDNPELAKEIEAKIREKIKGSTGSLRQSFSVVNCQMDGLVSKKLISQFAGRLFTLFYDPLEIVQCLNIVHLSTIPVDL